MFSLYFCKHTILNTVKDSLLLCVTTNLAFRCSMRVMTKHMLLCVYECVKHIKRSPINLWGSSRSSSSSRSPSRSSSARSRSSSRSCRRSRKRRRRRQSPAPRDNHVTIFLDDCASHFRVEQCFSYEMWECHIRVPRRLKLWCFPVPVWRVKSLPAQQKHAYVQLLNFVK